MNLAKLALTIPLSTLFLLITFLIFLGTRYARRWGDQGYIFVSLIFSLFASTIVILSIAGFIPVLRGFHPAWWIIIALWLFYSIPFIGRVEIYGNIIVDALFISIFVTIFILFSAAGLNELFYRRISFSFFKAWLILSMVFAIITVSFMKIFVESRFHRR